MKHEHVLSLRKEKSYRVGEMLKFSLESSGDFGKKGNFKHDNVKITKSKTECSSLNEFPEFSLENFPTDNREGKVFVFVF